MFITPLSTGSVLSGMNEVTAAKSGVADNHDTGGITSFGETLKNALQGVRDLEEASNQASYDLAMGLTDDVEGAMLAATKASTAIEMTVQLTTRAVNAYKEIMSMQI